MTKNPEKPALSRRRKSSSRQRGTTPKTSYYRIQTCINDPKRPVLLFKEVFFHKLLCLCCFGYSPECMSTPKPTCL